MVSNSLTRAVDGCGALSVGFYFGGLGDAGLCHLFLHAGEYGLVRLFLGFVVRHMRMMSCGHKQYSSIQHSFNKLIFPRSQVGFELEGYWRFP
jgi:hypothetical protein